jgi:hypothetical protein
LETWKRRENADYGNLEGGGVSIHCAVFAWDEIMLVRPSPFSPQSEKQTINNTTNENFITILRLY